MTAPREHCLDTAKDLVSRDRAEEYGELETNARRWANLMTATFGHPHFSTQYPIAMIQTKIARLMQNPGHLDSWTDIAGYAALGYELAAKLQRGDA